MSNDKEKIAAHLLNINAVVLQPDDPFIWSSGLKAPIYCDNRLTLSYPAIRSDIANGFAERIHAQYPEVEVIAGAATGGIAHAAWVSEKLDVPMVYVRGKAKDHGKKSQIEGVVKPGQRVVVIEDLISTGTSSLAVAEALRNEGCEVQAVLAIFSYDLEEAKAAFSKARIPYETLTDYPTLINVAVQTGKISPQQLTLLKRWHQNPKHSDWMKQPH